MFRVSLVGNTYIAHEIDSVSDAAEDIEELIEDGSPVLICNSLGVVESFLRQEIELVGGVG